MGRATNNTEFPITDNLAADRYLKVNTAGDVEKTNGGEINAAGAAVAVAALEVDWSTGNIFSKSITTGETWTFANVKEGQKIILDVTSSSGAALTLPGSVLPMNGGSFTADDRNIIEITAISASEQTARFNTV